jgi:hypothetical protein
MNPLDIMKQVQSAIEDEKQNHRLRNTMIQVARMHGRKPTEKELDEAVEFVIEYINHAPFLLIAMHGAAQKHGLQASLRPLLQACQEYWEAGVDLVPDHLGLLGYMDDAYYMLSIIQGIAERHRQPDGSPILDLKLGSVNQTMRGLIGEPPATILDAAVAAALAGPGADAMLQGWKELSGRNLVDRDPIWGNASIDEIVDARMGALGIV